MDEPGTTFPATARSRGPSRPGPATSMRLGAGAMPCSAHCGMTSATAGRGGDAGRRGRWRPPGCSRLAGGADGQPRVGRGRARDRRGGRRPRRAPGRPGLPATAPRPGTRGPGWRPSARRTAAAPPRPRRPGCRRTGCPGSARGRRRAGRQARPRAPAGRQATAGAGVRVSMAASAPTCCQDAATSPRVIGGPDHAAEGDHGQHEHQGEGGQDRRSSWPRAARAKPR